MEPTIYKPSIYKSAGIYKAEAGGGVSDCVEIAGKYYKTKKINNTIWITENLSYIDDNIYVGDTLTSLITALPTFNFYNFAAVVYLTNNANNIFNGWRVANIDDYQYLMDNYQWSDLLTSRFGGNNSSELNFECSGIYNGTNFDDQNDYGEYWIANDSYSNPADCFQIEKVNQNITIGHNYMRENYRPVRLCKDA